MELQNELSKKNESSLLLILNLLVNTVNCTASVKNVNDRQVFQDIQMLGIAKMRSKTLRHLFALRVYLF